jgi:hypothetical protein
VGTTNMAAPSIQIGVTAGIFLASILLKEMRYLVYIKYLWSGADKDYIPMFSWTNLFLAVLRLNNKVIFTEPY